MSTKEQIKSSNLKQTCVNCHFFAYAMKSYNRKTDQYSSKVVDKYYRNWIKEKCYNYNQSTEIPEECDYSRGYDNEKAPTRCIVGLKCYKNVWPEERFIGFSWGIRMPITPDMKTCSFLHTVPMYREKAFEEITEVDRSDSCFFREYKPGMSFEAAEELERREEKRASSQPSQNKGESNKIESLDTQQLSNNEFFLSGNMWTISYEGKTIHLQASKGLQYIHCLLENPGKEFHSLELLRGITPDEKIDDEEQKGQAMEEGLSVGGTEGSTGNLLEEDTIKEYRERYAELKSELEDGELSPVEITENEEEMAQIMKELTAGLDKRGQSRKFSDPVEKSRKSVSRAIKASLDKIKDGIPALWKHFYNTLTPGINCSYKPENPIPWDL